jgi:hypothetical protein
VEPRGFQWVDVNNHLENVIAFMRHSAAGERVICVSNFSAAPRPGYRFGLPEPGTYRLVLNTDSSYYSGSDRLTINCVEAEGRPWHGLPFSAVVDLPPLTTLWFDAPKPNAPAGANPGSCEAPPNENPAAPPAAAKKSRKRAPAKMKTAEADEAGGAKVTKKSAAGQAARKASKRSPRKKAE